MGLFDSIHCVTSTECDPRTATSELREAGSGRTSLMTSEAAKIVARTRYVKTCSRRIEPQTFSFLSEPPKNEKPNGSVRSEQGSMMMTVSGLSQWNSRLDQVSQKHNERKQSCCRGVKEAATAKRLAGNTFAWKACTVYVSANSRSLEAYVAIEVAYRWCMCLPALQYTEDHDKKRIDNETPNTQGWATRASLSDCTTLVNPSSNKTNTVLTCVTNGKNCEEDEEEMTV